MLQADTESPVAVCILDSGTPASRGRIVVVHASLPSSALRAYTVPFLLADTIKGRLPPISVRAIFSLWPILLIVFGAGSVAQANPDGYTLLIVSANYTVRAAMYKVPYRPVGDFAPISQLASVPLLLVVHPSLPVKSVSELVTYARSNPGKLNYSSPGNGSLVHLAGELFKSTSNVEMVHVAYKGVAAAFTDLLAGQIQLTFTGILTARPHIKAGRLRGLAVTSLERAKAAPDYPTMMELGVEKFEATQWHGLLAPKGTPEPILNRLNKEIVSILRQPEVATQMVNGATEPVGSSRKAFAAFIRSDYEKWQRVVKRAGIRGD